MWTHQVVHADAHTRSHRAREGGGRGEREKWVTTTQTRWYNHTDMAWTHIAHHHVHVQ